MLFYCKMLEAPLKERGEGRALEKKKTRTFTKAFTQGC